KRKNNKIKIEELKWVKKERLFFGASNAVMNPHGG
ncbi:unnamed protein product, partial [marine sediment metagenome]